MPRALMTAVFALSIAATQPATAATPNVVLIYADDVGYGDLGCYGAQKIRTPNLDRLAAQGLRFTDAHCASATCTPSRYALMTGEYAWRRPGTGVLPGNASLIIEPGRLTLPALFKGAGYRTGVVGKWHLGLGSGELDWNGPIRPGPLELGFDRAFILPATGDRVPCVYVEDHGVAGLDPKDPIRVNYGAPVGDEPTGREHPELLKMKLSHGHDNTIVNGISRIGYMTGGRSARWVDEDMADVFTRQAVSFIESNRDRPFFLYFASHDIHVPRVPHPRFAGKSGCGVRGDVMEELDWCVGQVLDALDRTKLTEKTLVIFTSDNGPVVDDGYDDGSPRDLNGHRPAGPLRGGKYSIFEGGTRVPFLVSWPGTVRPGVSNALVCQVDFLSSFAAMIGGALPEGAAPDSLDVWPALVGKRPAGRADLVEHANGLALREGRWKFIPAAPNPGAPAKKKAAAKTKGPVIDRPGAGVQLFDLDADLAETKNVAGEHPEVVTRLRERLEAVRKSPHRRLPPPQASTGGQSNARTTAAGSSRSSSRKVSGAPSTPQTRDAG